MAINFALISQAANPNTAMRQALAALPARSIIGRVNGRRYSLMLLDDGRYEIAFTARMADGKQCVIPGIEFATLQDMIAAYPEIADAEWSRR